MNISIVAVTVFAALASGFGLVCLAVRDIRHARAVRRNSAANVRLQRMTRIPAGRPEGNVARFDRWFQLLIRESALLGDTTTGVLLVVLCGAVLGAILFLWQEQPAMGILGAFVGTTFALVAIAVVRARRISQIREQLPGSLDMLARSLRAGLSIDQAIEQLAAESPEPLAAEFRLCAKQLAMGLSLASVMRSLVDRVRLFDVRIFTATLSVHRETGGNVAKVLERLAVVIRDRVAYRRQLRAVTAAGRFSAILIGAIGPALFVYLFFWHPEYIRIMVESSFGQTLLILAALLETIGLIWTARLLKPVY